MMSLEYLLQWLGTLFILTFLIFYLYATVTDIRSVWKKIQDVPSLNDRARDSDRRWGVPSSAVARRGPTRILAA
jgi:hypothetical protein